MRPFRVPVLLLGWYIGLLVLMSVAPLDPKVWYAQNILPLLFTATLVATHRGFPLSTLSYVAITAWLTLHTVGVHYTYPKVPFGFWMEQWFHFQRNHFDRIVHFGFGFLMAYPLEETFRRLGSFCRWQINYFVIITILGFSALWEIFEAWLGQLAHADLEKAFVGHQGDVWDPQHDMASALYGTIACLILLSLSRALASRRATLQPESAPVSTSLIS